MELDSNFFTEEKLTPPLQIALVRGGRRTEMADASSGDCNACHSAESVPDPGRVLAP